MPSTRSRVNGHPDSIRTVNIGQLVASRTSEDGLGAGAKVAGTMEVEARAKTGPDFGTLLRRYRIAAGLSQDALAERARMSSDGISALERGHRRTPQREIIALLADALALNPEQYREFEAAVGATRRRTALAPPCNDRYISAERAGAEGADARERGSNHPIRGSAVCDRGNDLDVV
jgi:transcriptional regulator with XRE-family HTH domain